MSAKTHGMKSEKIYTIWCAMKSRCFYKSNNRYKIYGGRGITVCDRWKNSFINFYEDFGKDYEDNLSIDRIDNNGDYCKENCRWATRKEQANNKRNNVYYLYKNNKKTLAQFAKEYNIPYKTLWARVNRFKWSLEKSLTISPEIYKNRGIL